MAEKQNLTAAQRAANFAMATRQNLQMMATQSTTTGASTVSFTLPKARLLSKIILDFEIKFTAKHASSTSLPVMNKFTPFKLVRRISLSLNDGFQPYVVSGTELAMLNMISRSGATYVLDNISNSDVNAYGYWLDKGASATGKENTVHFTLEMPITLNDRDAISMLLLQNAETVADLIIDFANAGDMFKNATGYTFDITKASVTPLLETFSIPASTEAFPDLSVLKLTTGRNETFMGAGQHTLKLNTGTIYRRLVLYFTDENGEPIEDSDITSNINLVFNTADTNYSVTPRMLRMLNTTYYGYTLPKGMFVFDMTFQGTPNMGGTRDYIDTERLTCFECTFTTQKTVKVSIVSEVISRLR